MKSQYSSWKSGDSPGVYRRLGSFKNLVNPDDAEWPREYGNCNVRIINSSTYREDGKSSFLSKYSENLQLSYLPVWKSCLSYVPLEWGKMLHDVKIFPAIDVINCSSSNISKELSDERSGEWIKLHHRDDEYDKNKKREVDLRPSRFHIGYRTSRSSIAPFRKLKFARNLPSLLLVTHST